MAAFKIKEKWATVDIDKPLERATAAHLKISVDNTIVTRNVNAWKKRIQDTILVSAYPLAMWFASSWWRLNYEPARVNESMSSFPWRKTHEMGAAGSGYVWPGLVFSPDGESMSISSRGIMEENQSITYLPPFLDSASVPSEDFQDEVMGFVAKTVAKSGKGTELAELFQILEEERRDEQVAMLRRIEALLGYDPDECPASAIQSLYKHSRRLGKSSLYEITPALEGKAETLSSIENAAGEEGTPRISLEKRDCEGLPPWTQGFKYARDIREKCGLGDGPVEEDFLNDALGIHGKDDEITSPLRATVARKGRHGFTYLFRRCSHSSGRRFEKARLVGDALQYGTDGWLVSTDFATARQKKQRSFAAELLCPIDSLKEKLNGDYSDENIEEAAVYFKVSSLLVRSHLQNNGVLRRP